MNQTGFVDILRFEALNASCVGAKQGCSSDVGGQVYGVLSLEADGQHLTAVRAVTSPDKLAHLSL